ncbi:MAG: hypothetical protein F4227_09795 [Gammaproteobacteria bacterium]|nr:hypothetical protein [Gammaproteobacteria bacterium]
MKPLFTCGLFVFAVGVFSSNGDVYANPLLDKTLHENSVERFVAVYSYVADLPIKAVESKLQELTKNTRQRMSSRVKDELQIALLQRLTSENPSNALELALACEEEDREKFVQTVFDSWATEDLEAAVEHAKSLDWSDRRQALDSIVRANLELPLQKLRDIATKLSLEKKYAIEVYRAHVKVELIEEPRKVWYQIAKFITEDHTEYDRGDLLERLAIHWFDKDGFAIIEEIQNLNGRDISPYAGKYDSILAIVDSAARRSPRKAFEYVTNLPEREYSLEELVIRRWAETDVHAAIEAVASIGSADTREDWQREIANVWADKEPRYILQNLNVLPERARYVAARAGVAKIAESSLHEAGDLALQIKDSSLRTIAVRWLLPIWSEREPHSLLDWFLKNASSTGLIEEIREQLVYHTLDSDPVRAFQFAVEHQIMNSSGTSGIGLEAQILYNISRKDLNLARELLADVRDGITKRVATLHVGRAMRYQGDIREAMDLAQDLTETEQDWYFSLIIFDWIDGDPSGLVDEISIFPTVDLRSTVAQRLLRWNRRYDKLTDKQIETLQKHLKEDDVDQLYFQW